jgi:hypothetical protein
LVKIKLHLLPHLLDDIRRFGPAIRFSTESFEAYNTVFRQCSILSNHLAPSRDISLKFCSLERIKHVFSGGYSWDPGSESWRRAGTAVWELIQEHPIFQRHLGWVTPEEHPALQDLVSLRGAEHCQWSKTKTSKYLAASEITDLAPSPTDLWCVSSKMVARSGDEVCPHNWVIFSQPSTQQLEFGRVVEILVSKRPHQQLVVIEKFECSERLHPDFGWPILSRWHGQELPCTIVLPQNVAFSISVQHDCHQGQCKPAPAGFSWQECQQTTQ